MLEDRAKTRETVARARAAQVGPPARITSFRPDAAAQADGQTRLFEVVVPVEFDGRVKKQPRRVVRLQGTDSDYSREGASDARWPEDLVGQLDMFLDDAMAMLPQLRAAYENDRPDLFLYDIGCSTARILGENWGIPAVQLSPSMVAWEG